MAQVSRRPRAKILVDGGDPEETAALKTLLGGVDGQTTNPSLISTNAATYAATRGTSRPAYVSPFIGRLDDRGQNGVDLVANIKRMYRKGDGHVLVLAASIRSVAHLLACFALDADLVTVPASVLREWAAQGFPLPDERFAYKPAGATVAYQELDLDQPWTRFELSHELTTQGVEKFAADYRATLNQP